MTNVIEWEGKCPKCNSALEFHSVQRGVASKNRCLFSRTYVLDVVVACFYCGHRIDVNIVLLESGEPIVGKS